MHLSVTVFVITGVHFLANETDLKARLHWGFQRRLLLRFLARFQTGCVNYRRGIASSLHGQFEIALEIALEIAAKIASVNGS